MHHIKNTDNYHIPDTHVHKHAHITHTHTHTTILLHTRTHTHTPRLRTTHGSHTELQMLAEYEARLEEQEVEAALAGDDPSAVPCPLCRQHRCVCVCVSVSVCE